METGKHRDAGKCTAFLAGEQTEEEGKRVKEKIEQTSIVSVNLLGTSDLSSAPNVNVFLHVGV